MFYDKKLVVEKLLRWEEYLRGYRLPKWEELPAIELYMEQVIALLTQYLDFLPQGEHGERIVTVSAVNNYVRMKIMPAPRRKKYGRVHIAYLIMICTLKQSVNIAYVQKMIPMGLSEGEVRLLYGDYVEKHRAATLYFIEQVNLAARHVLDPEDQTENAVANLVSSAAVIAGFSKTLTERLVKLQDESPKE